MGAESVLHGVTYRLCFAAVRMVGFFQNFLNGLGKLGGFKRCWHGLLLAFDW